MKSMDTKIEKLIEASFYVLQYNSDINKTSKEYKYLYALLKLNFEKILIGNN